MADTKKTNSFWIKTIYRLIDALTFVLGQLIKDEETQELALSTLKPIKSIVGAVTDEDPDNKAQILKIVKMYASQDAIPYAHDELIKIINRIGDDKVRSVVQVTSKVPFMIGQIWTDDNPSNLKQTRTYLEQWLEDAENQKVLIDYLVDPLIRGVFKKQVFLANMLLGTIKDKLADINIDIDKDGE